MSGRFDGKVAVVLGASAPGGTGAAVARGLANEGARVVVAARSIEPLRRLADEIDGLAVECDAGDEAQIAALADAAVATHGRIDIAVNAAGLPVAGSIADADPGPLQEALRVNYLGNVWFVKRMAAAIGADGSIVLISSMSATHPVAPHFAYACAKAAADCLVRYAALEYGARNIRVNSVLPGSIRSDLARAAFAIPGFEAAFAAEIPLGRVAEPADIADAVLWLAGPAYATGLNLQINGGNHLTRFPQPPDLADAGAVYSEIRSLGDRS